MGRPSKSASKPTRAPRASKKAKKAPEAPRNALPPAVSTEECHYCGKALKPDDRALFVEEEIGRIFCNENCITEYFAPEIERLEQTYEKHAKMEGIKAIDPEEREKLNHLRWVTLSEPDEIWVEKTVAGDYRYTLVSEFEPEGKRTWYVCVCLFLRGEPSFLFVGFPTRSRETLSKYRVGEKIERVIQEPDEDSKNAASLRSDGETSGEGEASDGLAQPWTPEELFISNLARERSFDDIPQGAFGEFTHMAESTLENPDELWVLQLPDSQAAALFHFIKRFEGESQPVWYVIVARETENDEEIEVLEAFPTKDPHFVTRYRQGERQGGSRSSASGSGDGTPSSESRIVH